MADKYLSVQSNLGGLSQWVRDVRGRLTGAASRSRAALRPVGQELQQNLVREAESSYVRRGASTGKLARALGNKENLYVGTSSIGVMNETFMFSDAGAKYWRAIDAGSDHAVGRVLVGYWTNPRSGHGPHSPNQRFHGGMYDVARENGRIKRPIRAHNYVDAAWKATNVRAQANEIAERILGF